MKILSGLVISISLLSFVECQNSKPEQPRTMDVHHYVELLKTGNYEDSELPNFSSKDIPALLEYRNETQLIKDFPTNMISSFWLSECELGMYVLWTIESIRAVAIDSEYLIGRFPSQNPIVQRRDAPYDMDLKNEAHEVISKSYFDWWEVNKDKDFEEFKQVDPLIETEYRWH